MTRHNYKYLSVIMEPVYQALPIRNLAKQSSLTHRLFHSVRTIGVSLIVIAALLSTVDASALTRSKGTKYGTLTYSINLEDKYKPGEHYIITASFAANSKVFGKEGYSSFMTVTAGGQTICSRTVMVRKNRTSSTAASFTAPSDGSTLVISFGNHGRDVFESISIPSMPIEQDSLENQGDTIANEAYDTGDVTNDEENAGVDEDLLSSLLDKDMMDAIKDYLAQDPLGLDRQATPEEAVGVGSVAALLAALLGGAGAVGGGVGGALGGLGGLGGGAAGAGAGGAFPPPIEGAPSGPPPIENPFQSIEDKYVTRYTDGSISLKDPVTGEERLYLPDGEGGYDNPLGGGFRNDEDMLNHLAYLERNKDPLSLDAATAAQNQAEQHAQWEEQNARDLARGYSDEMADYKDWLAQQERDLKKEDQIARLASQFGVEATEEAVRKALKKDMIEAGIESAKQEAEAARDDMIIVGLESTKNVAATSLVLIPLAASGVGVMSASSLANAKIVHSCYTMAASVTDKVGDAYVKGENMATAAVHGTVLGALEVAQNYAGDIGGLAAGKLAGNASGLVKGTVNLGTEAAVYIGGEGLKEGYKEYTTSGDLNKTIDATVNGLIDGTKKHAVNKTVEYGFNKTKELATSAKSSKPSAVDTTRANVDSTGKTLTSSKQAATQAQNKLTTAQQRATAAQQTAARSQQLVAKAKGDVKTANKDLQTANKKLEAAQNKLKLANKNADANKIKQANEELAKAQRNAEVAQKNFNRANKTLDMTEKADAAAKRVAVNAEHNLQSAQMGAQKAQSDLKAATDQHHEALRNAYAAEQQAQVDQFNDKMMAQVRGSDIVSGGRAIEEHLKNEGYIPKK